MNPTTPDFEPIPEAELRPLSRWDRPDYVEDAEFEVVDDGQDGEAWDVWALTYPLREADARRYLDHFDTSEFHNGDRVYWYRDRRNEKVYGMPDIELVRAENERITGAYYRADLRSKRLLRLLYAYSMFLVATLFIGLPLAPDVVPWLWVASAAILPFLYRARQHLPRPRYDRLTEVRFDIFVSDREIHERRQRLIANVLTVGFAALLLWLFSRD
jgi:hypothetical protein